MNVKSWIQTAAMVSLGLMGMQAMAQQADGGAAQALRAEAQPRVPPPTWSGSPTVLTFVPSVVGVSGSGVEKSTISFQLANGTGFVTPTATLHYGTSYSAGAVSCTGTGNPAETCSVQISFTPQFPGGRRDALFLMSGTTRLATVLIYGVGQAPLGLIQPGVITTPIKASPNYQYTSIVDENGTAYVVEQGAPGIESVTKAGVVTTLPITGLNSPRSVGIDGAGVLYIADQTAHGPTITYDTVQGIQGSIPFPAGAFYIQSLAVGNTGNIYETDGSGVYTITPAGTSTYTAFNPVLNPGPSIIATDSSDNAFLSSTHTIWELPLGAAAQTVVNSVGAGDGLGVDAAGSLYASRYGISGSDSVGELAAADYTTDVAILDATASPLGSSVGPDGTVYVGNYNNLDKVDRTQGLVAFGNNTTGTQNVAIYNGGNQSLTVSNIAITGSSAFSLGTASTNNCTGGSTMPPGAFCQVAVVYSTTHAGFFNGTLTFTDTSLNSATSTQTVAITAESQGIYVVPSPASLNFGNQAIGTTSATQTVTFTNNGDGYSAGISQPTGTGPFNVTLGTCVSPLVPLAVGASCQMNVSFSPTTATTYTNTSIAFGSTWSGPAQTVTFTVNGTGTSAAAPIATFGPASLAFGNQTVNTTSSSQALLLTNTGTAQLNLNGITFTGSGAAAFSQTSTCGGGLAPNASCTINVSFAPTTTGPYSATLNLADNAAVTPATAALTGTGTAVAAPTATLSPNPLSFPNTTVGVPSAPLLLTLTNGGNAPLTSPGYQINSGSFNSVGSTCTSSLPAGASCTFSLVFTPLSAGPLTASFQYSDNAAGSPHTVTLSGTGVAAAAPQAVLSPSPLTFAPVTVGTPVTLPMTLSNPGTATLNISTITVTGANASNFTFTNGCSASLGAGLSCTLMVTFTPTSATSFAAAISVADNATGSPHTAALSGSGTAPLIPVVAPLSPNPLAFASTNVGSTAAGLPVTVSNTGTAALTGIAFSITGTNPSDFATTSASTCGTTLAAGASCLIYVSFTPASAATFAATLSVTDNASGSPQTAALSGTGTAVVTTGVFTVTSSTSTQSVQPGALAQYNLTIAPLGGTFNSLVTLSATGLPTGATASFLPAAVTPGSTGAPSVLSIQTPSLLGRLASPDPRRSSPVPLLALLGVPLLGLAARRRMRKASRGWRLLAIALLTILPMLAVTGCGGGYFGPAPQTFTVTVVGTSGSLQESTTVSLTVQ